MFPVSVQLRASDWLKLMTYIRIKPPHPSLSPISTTEALTTTTAPCPICFCEFEMGEIVVRFDICGHTVHKLCMLQYFMHHDKSITTTTSNQSCNSTSSSPTKSNNSHASTTATLLPPTLIGSVGSNALSDSNAEHQLHLNPVEHAAFLPRTTNLAIQNKAKPLKCLQCHSYCNTDIINDLSL
jgi:hypothetical protein